jgi:hypothetical protein
MHQPLRYTSAAEVYIGRKKPLKMVCTPHCHWSPYIFFNQVPSNHKTRQTSVAIYALTQSGKERIRHLNYSLDTAQFDMGWLRFLISGTIAKARKGQFPPTDSGQTVEKS